MSLRRRSIKGAAVLAGGRAAGQGLGLARNVLVARLIGPEDFGIAATFAVAMSLLEMVSDLAMDRMLVQAKDGEDPRMQATAHLLQVLRGVALGAVMFVLAGPVARLFDAGQAVWAFQVVALVPVIRGLAHLDMKRAHRGLSFGPGAIADIGSQALVLAAAYPLGVWLGDYSAGLWLLIAQAAIFTAATHLVATRRYAWAWDRQLAARFAGFGWPLLVNGVLLFLILQGDRVVIGSAFSSYTIEDLGIYSAAVVLAMAPAMMLGTLNTSLLLPLLSSVQADRAAFLSRYRVGIEASAAAGVAMALGLIALADPMVPLLFGAAYAPAAAVLPWLAFSQAMRIVRMSPTVAAMALTDTKNLMWSNAARAVAVLAMICAAAMGADLWVLAACGVGGEVLAMGVSAVLLERRAAVPAAAFLKSGIIAAVVIIVAGIVPSLALVDVAEWYRLPILTICSLAGLSILLWRSRSLPTLLGTCSGDRPRRPLPTTAVECAG